MEGSSTGPGIGGIQTYTDSSGDTCWADDRLPLLATLPNGIAVTNSFCRARYVEYQNLRATGRLSERLAYAPISGPQEEATYLELINRFISNFEAGDMATALRAERGVRSIEAAWAQGRSGIERRPPAASSAAIQTASGTPGSGSITGPLGHCLYVSERSAAGINYGIRSSCISTIEARSQNRYPRDIWCDVEGGRQESTQPGIAIFRLVASEGSCFGCGVLGSNIRLSNCQHYCDRHNC